MIIQDPESLGAFEIIIHVTANLKRSKRRGHIEVTLLNPFLFVNSIVIRLGCTLSQRHLSIRYCFTILLELHNILLNQVDHEDLVRVVQLRAAQVAGRLPLVEKDLVRHKLLTQRPTGGSDKAERT